MEKQKPGDRKVCYDEKEQLQPATKEAAQKMGVKEQKEAAKEQTELPGQPAKGE